MPEQPKPRYRIDSYGDWITHAAVVPPADRQLHQHSDTSNRNARYLATGAGGVRYPPTAASRRTGGKDGEELGATARSVKAGGGRIEYQDRDPRIRPPWLAELKKNGGRANPVMHQRFPQRAAAE